MSLNYIRNAEYIKGVKIPLYYAEGDSITLGSGDPDGDSYPDLFGADTGNSVFFGSNFAQASAKLNNNSGNSVVERAAADDAVLSSGRGSRYILSCLIGRNGLTVYPGGTTAFLTDYAAYCDARRTAGWKLIVCTLTPSTFSGFNTDRAIVNTAITTTWSGVHADSICDFGGDSTMGPDAAALDTTLYLDGTHPTVLGQQNLEAIIKPIINALHP